MCAHPRAVWLFVRASHFARAAEAPEAWKVAFRIDAGKWIHVGRCRVLFCHRYSTQGICKPSTAVSARLPTHCGCRRTRMRCHLKSVSDTETTAEQHAEVMKLLLNEGAEVDRRDKVGPLG